MPPLEIQVFSPSSTACVAVDARGALHRRDVGAGIGLGQREGGDRLAARHARQLAPFCAACRPG